MGWTLLDAPLDSAGAGRGEERGPAALRAAGIAAALGANDRGDVTGVLRPAARDPETGVIAVEALRAASASLRDAVAEALSGGERPLVLGGDCSLLPGALAGCRIAGHELGLWMVDGHPDALDGETSPTGEAADMDLAIALGRGPKGLVDLAGNTPLVSAERVVLLGTRPPGEDPDNDRELALVPPAVFQLDARAIGAAGAAEVGRGAERRLARAGPAWLHLDLDVLDGEAMPAVSYPQPHGLSWDELEKLLAPLAASPALIGMSVADLEADRDREGTYARRVVELLSASL